MNRKLVHALLLCGALIAPSIVQAQEAQPHHAYRTEYAVTLDFEHAQVAQTGGNRFWLEGGSSEAAITFWRNLGLAGILIGEHASNVNQSVGLSKIAFMAGPRYTFDTSRYSKPLMPQGTSALFLESLYGGAHAFDSLFPGAKGAASSASSFSMLMGGGVDIGLKHGFAIRALEVDWVHTALPNNAGNSQNGLRLAFGIAFSR
jgi:hypothetical protein